MALLLLAATVAVQAMDHRILPKENTAHDRQGREITEQTYEAGGIKGWHGTTSSSDPETFFRMWGTDSLWLADYSSSALAAVFLGKPKPESGLGKREPDFLYLFRANDGMKSLLNLPYRSAEENGKILKEFSSPAADTPVYAMGQHSGRVRYTVIPQLCKRYGGWRSPWDQNEFMICANQQVEHLELAAALVCDLDGYKARALYRRSDESGETLNPGDPDKRLTFDADLVDEHGSLTRILKLTDHCWSMDIHSEGFKALLPRNGKVKIYQKKWAFRKRFLKRDTFAQYIQSVPLLQSSGRHKALLKYESVIYS
eukprot:TRINITY_DN65838_c3_g12_i1.p1 TRINITY_DN65838_c3_g12~~TRINITY_DN65838_c3_g12_i1.p1  ORF type:complete len:331 (+),score=88.22 TRINITY_DN65838_c3_g12_i1:56-994(+)